MKKKSKIIIFLSTLLLVSAVTAIYLKLNEDKESQTEKPPIENKEASQKQPQANSSDSKTVSVAALPTISKIDASVSNVWGNTPGNIANGGFFAFQDSYLYFNISQLNRMNISTNTPKLSRSKEDGVTGLTILDSSTTPLNINVVGEWLYFRDNNNSICKIKVTGEDYQLVYPGYNIYLLIVHDNTLYFLQDRTLLKSSINSPMDTTKLADNVGYFTLTEDGKNIIYVDYTVFTNPDNFSSDTKPSLFKMNVDGQNRVQINTLYNLGSSTITAYKNYIYFLNYADTSLPPYVGRLSMNSKNSTVEKYIVEEGYIPYMNLNGKFLYYVSYSNTSNYLQFKKKDLDTGSVTTIEGDRNIYIDSTISVFNDKIYFFGSGDKFNGPDGNGNSMFCIDFKDASIKEMRSFNK